MQLQVKGKNLEVNEAIRLYAERKLEKLSKQLREDAPVELVLAVERNPSIAANQVAEATIRLKGHVLHAHEAAPDMKAAIDEVVEKLHRQIRDHREKSRAWYKRKRQAASPPAG